MNWVIKLNQTKIKQMTKQAIDNLISELEAGRSEQLKKYLAMIARFHRYSCGNIILISLQRPDATRVAGFKAWQRLGRSVKSGEKAIRILSPVVIRNRDDAEEEKLVTFKSACVFDISQTNGKPLTEFAKVQGDPGEYMGVFSTS